MAGRGTTPITLSDNGREVVGYYADAAGLFHGFTLRDGQYTTLDVPFAGATATFAQGVDDAGLVSGAYLDASGVFHGFTLWHGHYTAVNYPGPTATGTALVSMNNHGTVAAVWDQGSMIARLPVPLRQGGRAHRLPERDRRHACRSASTTT